MSVDIGEQLYLDKLGLNKIGSMSKYDKYEKLFNFLSPIIKNVYVIASIILLFFIFIGGVGMILNAGNVEKQKQSSKTLGSAILGFGILFASYWIIKIIELITGTKIFNPPT